MNKLVINGKEYNAVEFDVDVVCYLEEIGISLDEYDTKQMSMMRGYIAYCMGTDVKTASKEISEHIKNGGKLSDFVGAMTQAVNDSGFFRSEQESAKESNPKSATSKK